MTKPEAAIERVYRSKGFKISLADAKKNRYVTVEYIGGDAREFAAVCRLAVQWSVADTPDLPQSDPADYESRSTDWDEEIAIGPTANEGLIARSKAIEWATKLGIPFRD